MLQNSSIVLLLWYWMLVMIAVQASIVEQNFILSVAVNLPDHWQESGYKLFIQTAKDHIPGVRIVMFVGAEVPVETIGEMTQLGIDIQTFEHVEQRHPNMQRWYVILPFLQQNYQRMHKVVFCDARDLYFQGDPFSFLLNPSVSKPQLLVGLEGHPTRNMKVTLGTERYMRYKIQHCFGKEELEHVSNFPVACAGFTLGAPKALLALARKIVMTQQVSCPNYTLGDQGIVNVVLARSVGMTESASFAVQRLKNGQMVLHLALLRKRRGIFAMNGTKLTSAQGLHVFPVVHQYDRIGSVKAYALSLLKRGKA